MKTVYRPPSSFRQKLKESVLQKCCNIFNVDSVTQRAVSLSEIILGSRKLAASSVASGNFNIILKIKIIFQFIPNEIGRKILCQIRERG